MRIVPVLAFGVVALAGCGASGGGERGCTTIGARPGVSLDIAPRPGQNLTGAGVTVCDGTGCRTGHAELRPATVMEPQGCTGAAPDDVCGARARATGGWYGFADVPDLRAGPYETTVVLTSGGTEVGRTTRNTAARLGYPNGPGCGGGVPRAEIRL
ncbi:hypothetical protein [Amycolatopsis endophytica]